MNLPALPRKPPTTRASAPPPTQLDDPGGDPGRLSRSRCTCCRSGARHRERRGVPQDGGGRVGAPLLVHAPGFLARGGNDSRTLFTKRFVRDIGGAAADEALSALSRARTSARGRKSKIAKPCRGRAITFDDFLRLDKGTGTRLVLTISSLRLAHLERHLRLPLTARAATRRALRFRRRSAFFAPRASSRPANPAFELWPALSLPSSIRNGEWDTCCTRFMDSIDPTAPSSASFSATSSFSSWYCFKRFSFLFLEGPMPWNLWHKSRNASSGSSCVRTRRTCPG